MFKICFDDDIFNNYTKMKIEDWHVSRHFKGQKHEFVANTKGKARKVKNTKHERREEMIRRIKQKLKI